MQPKSNEDQKQQLSTQKNSTRNYLSMMKNRSNIALSKIIVRKISAMPEQNIREKSEQKDKNIITDVQGSLQDNLLKIEETENKDNIDTHSYQHQHQLKEQQNYFEQIPLKYVQNYKILYNKMIKKYKGIDEQGDISKYQGNNSLSCMIEKQKYNKNNKNNIDRSNKYIINTILTNYHGTNTIFSTQKLLNKLTSNPSKENQKDKNMRNKKGDKNNNLIKKIANKEKKNKKDNPQITNVSLDYIAKLEGYKTNIYKLIPVSYITEAKDTQSIAKYIKQFCGRLISGQYQRQIINQSYRFNKVYKQQLLNSQDQKLMNINKLKMVENYQKYKVLANKYINKQLQNIINSNIKLSQTNLYDQNSITKQLIRIFTQNINKKIDQDNTKKCQNSNYHVAIISLGRRNRRLNKKYKNSSELINLLFNNKVSNILQCKFLEFVTNIQTKLKLEVPETNFLECLQKQIINNCDQQNSSYLNQIKQNTYRQFRNNFTQYFINGPNISQQKHQNDQNMYIWPLFLNEQQLLSYNELMEGLKNKFQVEYHQVMANNSRNLVTGKMVYQIQDKIAHMKYKQAFWIRYCSNFIKNKNQNRNRLNRVTYIKSLEKEQIDKPRNNQILNNTNIEIMKKIKKPQQKSLYQHNNPHPIQINNHNQPHQNYRKSIYENLYSSNSHNNTNVDSIQINRLDTDNFYGNLIKKSKNNRKSLFQQKKSELERYINHLSHQQNKKASQPHKLNSRTNQVIIQSTPYKNPKNKNLHIPINPHNKYIKYNKYPIKFKQNLYFYSQDIHQCAIVYLLKFINLKELTLRFITDRRKYMVNTVKIIVHPQQKNIYHQKDTDTNKLLRAMQILNCLGANVTVQQQKPYQILESQQNITVQLLAFILGQNVQKIYQIYNKFNENY